ncbi:hypothetical protein L596_000103 [Steinernema carpocapsae]|uniref:C3H1-type domain-containing protein n=1 Tax=Steinernema carpocapsae TaxID=34508 RepID=A0A4U8UHN8_STECR|nr:hypothetical protein L596_000103 [Steinernema carpocapsae]
MDEVSETTATAGSVSADPSPAVESSPSTEAPSSTPLAVMNGRMPRGQRRNEAQRPEKREKKRAPVVCRNFNTPEGCRFGDKCRYSHEAADKNEEGAVKELPRARKPRQRNTKKSKAAVEESQTRPEAAADAKQEGSVPVPVTVQPPKVNPARVAVRPKKAACSAADKGTPVHRQIYNSEIHYIRRRYPTSKKTEVPDSTALTFPYEITNPEWVFDVKELEFTLTIDTEHPYVAPSIRVVRTDVLPEVLCKHIDDHLNELIMKKIAEYEASDSFEIVGKWLIRVIDRQIFSLFVSGLRKTKMVKEAEACGITVAKLPPPVKLDPRDEKPVLLMKTGSECPAVASEEQGDEKENVASAEATQETSSESDAQEKSLSESPSAIEVRFNWNDYTRNIGTLKARSMMFAVSCLKCPATGYFDCRESQKRASRCKRCGVGQSVFFKSEFVHANSNVAGYVQIKGCKPVDCILLSCKFVASCLKCNREFDVANLSNGVVNKSWCHDCHTKCEFAIYTASFHGNFNLIAMEDPTAPRKPQKKKVDLGPVIVVGQPLPDRGTCQHYKKSFRWFRFPCCGKTFPCDVCHEEAKMGHEISYANRIICGMCSFEQNFAKDKPCTNCNESTVKTKSTFWEGGKGCRNKLFMNKNDERKYKNSAMKTMPKKRTGGSAASVPFFTNPERRT